MRQSGCCSKQTDVLKFAQEKCFKQKFRYCVILCHSVSKCVIRAIRLFWQFRTTKYVWRNTRQTVSHIWPKHHTLQRLSAPPENLGIEISLCGGYAQHHTINNRHFYSNKQQNKELFLLSDLGLNVDATIQRRIIDNSAQTIQRRQTTNLVDPHSYIYTKDGDGRDKITWRNGTMMTTTVHSLKYTHIATWL